MGLRATTAARRSGLPAWVLGLLAAILLAALTAAVLAGRDGGASLGGSAVASQKIAYLAFGADADTLWLADPSDPARREALLVIPHAPAFGIVPALAPDGRSFAFNALPPATARPSRDAPAGLHLATLPGAEAPRLLAQDVDLLVAPVWSPDGASLVFRRSVPLFQLVALDLATGEEHVLISAESALFPVAFTPSRLLYVALAADGSDLYALDSAGGDPRHLARLADALTRDWTLSPQADRLAFLELSLTTAGAASRVLVLNLATRTIAPVSDQPGDEFGPVWRADGSLTLGRLAPSGAAITIASPDGALVQIGAPANGFESPLAWSAAGELLVRRFEGSSLVAPGRSSLALIDAAGDRRAVGRGDITLLGWLTP